MICLMVHVDLYMSLACLAGVERYLAAATTVPCACGMLLRAAEVGPEERHTHPLRMLAVGAERVITACQASQFAVETRNSLH